MRAELMKHFFYRGRGEDQKEFPSSHNRPQYTFKQDMFIISAKVPVLDRDARLSASL